MEKHAEQREAIQKFLAEIPDNLERIQRLRDLNITSEKLHQRTDAVLVAIFVVLERIVDRLTRSWAKSARTEKILKGVFKPKSKSKEIAPLGSNVDDSEDRKLDVTDALADLQTQVDAFQAEVDMCDKERFGRMESALMALTRELQGGLSLHSMQQTAIIPC